MILFRILLLSLVLTLALGDPASAAAKKKAAPPPAPSYRTAIMQLQDGKTDMARTMLTRGKDATLNKVLRGLLMAQPGNGYSFDEMAAFVTENPDWPGLKGIMMILEQKIPENASPSQIVQWFAAYPPLTPSGFSRYIEALEQTGDPQKARLLIKLRWAERDFTLGDEAIYYARYGTVLDAQDHWARLDRLLWRGEAKAARAMYPYVDEGRRALAETRLAMASSETPSARAEALASQVPAALQSDAGFQFEKARQLRRRDDTRGAIAILSDAPRDLVRPDLWWDERNILARRLIEAGEDDDAYRLITDHGLAEGFDHAQAEFLAGFLALRRLNRPELAHKHFSALFQESSTPITRARGLYWLGRTYEQAGQTEDARQSYEAASVLVTTFYGRLAIAKLEAQPVIRAASEPAIPANVRAAFFARDAIRAVEKLYAMNERDLARSFFKATIDFASKRVDFALALELAYRLQRPDWAVDAAKAAAQKNFMITGAAYPVLDLTIPTPPDLALTHALIRQESQFKADAGSPAGAKGLMQMMPATAKETARKMGLPYHESRLMNPEYNVRLGTAFIQRQIEGFDGSYILALAGYNAGPRRAREWISAFGDPRSPRVDPVDWIELIPIYETRNYVQRIIENLQFYRARLNKGQAPLSITEDLKR